MDPIAITEKISYIPCSEDPLSADIGIIRDGSQVWLYDIGSNPESIAGLEENCHVVISHFHADHTGNLPGMVPASLYVSGETRRHVGAGIPVDRDIRIGKLHIFPLPSSHCKGCLGLEVDETYAFVGDALYGKVKDGCYLYNAQLLRDEINILKKLKSPFLLVSHHPGMIRPKADVLAELEAIYALRDINSSSIFLPRD